jgi:hypothetical protein
VGSGDRNKNQNAVIVSQKVIRPVYASCLSGGSTPAPLLSRLPGKKI